MEKEKDFFLFSISIIQSTITVNKEIDMPVWCWMANKADII